MPKGFSEREKELIRAALLEKGRELLATYGIKKTSIEDLTSAAGISKGAFYLFYASKEELFADILELFEAEFQATLLKEIAQPGESPRQRFKAPVSRVLALWKSNPLLARFGEDDYEHLVRKLSPERLQKLIRDDDVFAEHFIAAWRENGVVIEADPAIVAGLLRALFFVSLHQADFNPEAYPVLMEMLVDMVADRLVRA
jgi:AcrR family transcriptional regulator